MINLIYTIILFNILIIIFKLFAKYKVNNLQALIVNYLTATFCSYFFLETTFSLEHILQSAWLNHAIIIGTLFMITFNLYSFGIQKVGISVTTVANKMSLIIPVCAALILYPEQEKLTMIKAMALFLAFIGIYLCITESGKIIFNNKYLWIIITLFIGQGVCDAIFNDFAQTFINTLKTESFLFFMTLFFMASISGIIIHITKYNKRNNNIKLKNIIWGIAFGVPNFFSLFFFLKVLADPNIVSSIAFPLLSMGIVISSSLIGLYAFKERITRNNWIGILISICAIYLLSY